MTTAVKRKRTILVNKNLEKNLSHILISSDKKVSLRFVKPVEEMQLSRDYRKIAKEISDCGGYSGHCGCLNNACMMCTAFH